MKIHISDETAAWYKEELDLKNGDCIRFYARYGGYSTVQQGFSLGLSIEKPEDIGIKLEKNDITFFIDDKDLWYFDDKDLYVDFDNKHKEPEFRIFKIII